MTKTISNIRLIRSLPRPVRLFIIGAVGSFLVAYAGAFALGQENKTTSPTDTSNTASCLGLCNPTASSPVVTPTPSTTPNQNSTPAKTTQSPTFTQPTPVPVSMCLYDDYDKGELQNEYETTGDFEISQMGTIASQSENRNITDDQAVTDLNQLISDDNSDYASEYHDYLMNRQQYGCTVEVQPPTYTPPCPYSGYDEVANCIASIPTFPEILSPDATN